MMLAPLVIAPRGPDFAARLWGALPTAEGNVVVSPTSVEACLGLLIPAVGPTSRPPLARTLGAANLDAQAKTLQKRVADLTEDKETTVSSAFFSSEKPNERYVAAVGHGYGAKAERLLPGAAGLAQVNGWVKASTKGRIPKLFDHLNAPHLVLVNAVMFDGDWTIPFDAANTRKAEFHSPGGMRETDTMHRSGSLAYGEGKGFQAVDLPYAGGRYRMTVMLPGAGDPAAILRSDAWRATPMASRTVDLSLPKFELRSRPNVEEALKAMGLAPLFRGIDLSPALPGASHDRIDQIVHETWMEVDEKGTKAAAATGIAMTRAMRMPETPVVFRVDRPFAFAIRRVDGEALFEGVVREP